MTGKKEFMISEGIDGEIIIDDIRDDGFKQET